MIFLLFHVHCTCIQSMRIHYKLFHDGVSLKNSAADLEPICRNDQRRKFVLHVSMIL